MNTAPIEQGGWTVVLVVVLAALAIFSFMWFAGGTIRR